MSRLTKTSGDLVDAQLCAVLIDYVLTMLRFEFLNLRSFKSLLLTRVSSKKERNCDPRLAI